MQFVFVNLLKASTLGIRAGDRYRLALILLRRFRR